MKDKRKQKEKKKKIQEYNENLKILIEKREKRLKIIKKIFLINGSVLLSLAILFFIFVIFNAIKDYAAQPKPPQKFSLSAGNTAENIHNQGFMAVNEEYMFFYQVTPAQGLFRAKLNGKEQTLITEGYCQDINAVNGKVYFVMQAYGGHTSTALQDYYVATLYSMDFDGTNDRKLLENCAYAYVENDYVYYMYEVDSAAYETEEELPENYHYLYRYNLKTEKNEQLTETEIYNYQVKNNKVYYSLADGHLLCLDLDKEERTPKEVYHIHDDAINSFYINDDNTIIIGGYHSILKCNLKTETEETLHNNAGNFLSSLGYAISDDTVYFYGSDGGEYGSAYKKHFKNDDVVIKLFDLNEELSVRPSVYVFDKYCYFWSGNGLPKLIYEPITE